MRVAAHRQGKRMACHGRHVLPRPCRQRLVGCPAEAPGVHHRPYLAVHAPPNERRAACHDLHACALGLKRARSHGAACLAARRAGARWHCSTALQHCWQCVLRSAAFHATAPCAASPDHCLATSRCSRAPLPVPRTSSAICVSVSPLPNTARPRAVQLNAMSAVAELRAPAACTGTTARHWSKCRHGTLDARAGGAHATARHHHRHQHTPYHGLVRACKQERTHVSTRTHRATGTCMVDQVAQASVAASVHATRTAHDLRSVSSTGGVSSSCACQARAHNGRCWARAAFGQGKRAYRQPRAARRAAGSAAPAACRAAVLCTPRACPSRAGRAGCLSCHTRAASRLRHLPVAARCSCPAALGCRERLQQLPGLQHEMRRARFQL